MIKKIINYIKGDNMKINFFFPFKEDGKETKIIKVDTVQSRRFIFQKTVNQIEFTLINQLKGGFENQAVVLLAKHRNNWYWCNSIPYKNMFKIFKVLNGNKEEFCKNGFHKRILAAVFNTPVMQDAIKQLDKIQLNYYIESEYMNKGK